MATKKSRKRHSKAAEAKRWFSKNVMYEGERYTVDDEQAEAIVDEGKNAIVVARAGSGKTRTIVAKIIYLVAKCGVKPEEIMAFVFNANAAREINERLDKMRVDGENVINGVKIANTFHAFSRKVVYDVCLGREKSGEILAEEKESFILAIMKGMMKSKKWSEKIKYFLTGDVDELELNGIEGVAVNDCAVDENQGKKIDERMLLHFARMMTLFVNRAQQKFLAGENTLKESLEEYYALDEVGERERCFVELGAECYRRYHWLLLDERARVRLGPGLSRYGTDFNLIVSWASKLISEGRSEVVELLNNKKYILIDEYQDFSQLFLSVVLAIRKVCPEIRLFVVGDDWQAINRFAGSEVEYFKEFERYFPEGARRLEISTNYRCNYAIVGVARRFMARAMNEKGKFHAFCRRAGKVFLVNPNDFKVDYLDLVAKLVRENKKAKDILILHRNNEMNKMELNLDELKKELGKRLCGARATGVAGGDSAAGRAGVVRGRSRLTIEEFEAKVRIMTMHKSKGLEAEVVIILEADDGVIPKTHPDTKLYRVFGETEEVALADQKRLFYVAMTRAKKRLYIIYNPACGEGFRPYFGNDFERWEP